MGSAVVLCIHVAIAQDLKQVSPEEARQHIIKRVEPAYPSDAEMARIEGKTIVRVTIDENGNVTEIKSVMGHPILLQSTSTAVKQWKFQPFTLSGKTIPVSSVVQIDFWLGPGAAQHRQYLRQQVECIKQLQNNMLAEAEAACKKAMEAARKLPDRFALDKLQAYGDAANAASNAKKTDEALEDFKQQLEDFKQQLEVAQHALQAGSPQLVLIHSHLAHAYQAAGQMPQADAEYKETEKAQEAAQSELEGRKDKVTPESYEAIKASYLHNMQIILREHAALLRAMGKNSEAEALEQKAGSLANSQPINP